MRSSGGLDDGGHRLDLDDAAIVRRVTAISEIGSARVVRHWPNRVEIKVVELRPVAVLIGRGGQAATVASNGRVLAHIGVAPVGLPQISGISEIPGDGSVVAPQSIASVEELMPVALRQNLVVIDAGDVAGVVVRLHDVEIRLGRVEQREDVALKLNAAAAVLEHANACRKYVDVSVAYAPVAGC